MESVVLPHHFGITCLYIGHCFSTSDVVPAWNDGQGLRSPRFLKYTSTTPAIDLLKWLRVKRPVARELVGRLQSVQSIAQNTADDVQTLALSSRRLPPIATRLDAPGRTFHQ